MLRRSLAVGLPLGLLLLGCDSDPPGSTGETDAGPDGGFVFTDMGPPADMGRDAGRRDAGRDAGMADAGDPRVCGPKDICGDGLDNDCNGLTDDECPCEPGAEQRCYGGHPSEAGRGVCRYGMQTCSGGVGDEFGLWGECEGFRGPQPVECGGMMDWRCNGIIDEGCPCMDGETRDCYSGPDGTAGVGTCRAGTQTCEAMGDTAAFGACVGEVLPSPDRCDGTDTDCDGVPNTGCDCMVGDMRSCYSGPPATAGVGLCRAGTQECLAGAGGSGAGWGPCTGEVLPAADTCDGMDRACTGAPGAGCACMPGEMRSCYGGPMGTAGVGICLAGTQTCTTVGGMPAWPSDCAGQVLPGTEVCMNMIDDDCDGMIDEGCTPSAITCPDDVALPAGQRTMPLTATGAGLTSFSWNIVNAPTGGRSSALWMPNPPRSPTEVFQPYIVGNYDIEVSALDARGMTATCMFRVTALPHGFRVQLTWDGSGDIDLHVHSPNTARPWMSSDDCYWRNLAPLFGAVLDFDNIVGFGPENVRLDMPRAGETYYVGVHNYRDGRDRRATIEIFCGDTMSTVPNASFTSRALRGNAEGDCNGNDFWRVAAVRFTTPSTCEITPLDEYVTGMQACMSFDP